ncbi:MAG: TM0106 family RecB-like putative nuclease [Gammaproteobacteria bacterium]
MHGGHQILLAAIHRAKDAMSRSRPIYASDAVAWDKCRRLAWFAFYPPGDERPQPDHFQDLIRERGIEHENEILMSFQNAVQAQSVQHTRELMATRTPVIYQPQFRNDSINLVGTPDFLLLSGNSYQVGDAKLVSSVDKNRAIKIQLGVYQLLLRNVEDLAGADELAPVVFLGDGEAREVEHDVVNLAKEFIDDVTLLADAPDMPSTHFAYSKCSSCVFYDYCHAEFESRDDVTLSPAIDARTAKQLSLQNLTTLTGLANADPDEIQDAPYLRNADKRLRLIQQAKSLKTGEVIVRDEPSWPQGTMVHFDVESDPLGADGGSEVYLWGLLKPPYGSGDFDGVWRETDDFATWRSFLELIEDYRIRCPDLILVHYSAYEKTQIQQYAERYAGFQEPVVQWLLDSEGPLWDLQSFVKRNFVLPVESYGLKNICRDTRLVDFQWRLEGSGSQWSVVRYYDYISALAAGDVTEANEIKQEVLIYNEDDVRATAAMVDWLQSIAV